MVTATLFFLLTPDYLSHLILIFFILMMLISFLLFMLFRLALMSFVKLSFLSVFLNLLQELDILLCDQVETAWLAVSLNEFLKFMNVFLLFIPCLNNLHVLVPDELSKEALD